MRMLLLMLVLQAATAADGHCDRRGSRSRTVGRTGCCWCGHRRGRLFLLLIDGVLVYVVQGAVDDMPQNMRFAVTLQPGQHAGGQFGKVVHWQPFERVEHFIGDGTELRVETTNEAITLSTRNERDRKIMFDVEFGVFELGNNRALWTSSDMLDYNQHEKWFFVWVLFDRLVNGV